jgi:hypothetical protein
MPSVLLALWFVFTPAHAAEPVIEDDASIEDQDGIAGSDGEKDLDDIEVSRTSSTKDPKKKGDAAKTAQSLDDDEEIIEEEDEEPSLGDFEGPKPAAKAAPVAAPGPQRPGPIELDVAGKEPLKDNYPLAVVSVDRDAIVVELPVLVARSRAGNEKPFQVIGEVYVGEVKVSEVRQLIQPASLAEFGPSFTWMKVMAPVVEKTGEIKMIVKKANADGSAAAPLFTRVTPYQLK